MIQRNVRFAHRRLRLTVRYFEKPGKQNTQAIIEVVRTYLEEGG